MLCISATDVAIRSAHARGTLTLKRHWSDRFCEGYISIEDDFAVIEVALTDDAALARLDGIIGLDAAALTLSNAIDNRETAA